MLALCRCALFNATDATRHQIERLKDCYEEAGNDMSERIDALLNPKPNEMDGMTIVKSAN